MGDCFCEDHARLDELFRKFQEEKHSNLNLAKDYFEQFKFRLESHIVWEEELLFSLFEAKTGIQGPSLVAVMRTEYVQIQGTIETICAKIKNQNPLGGEDESVLLGVLSVHNLKEEDILYPMLDDTTNNWERKKISKKWKNICRNRRITS